MDRDSALEAWTLTPGQATKGPRDWISPWTRPEDGVLVPILGLALLMLAVGLAAGRRWRRKPDNAQGGDPRGPRAR